MSTSLPYELCTEAEPAIERASSRAEQLLRTMRKALNHDLPNQLVVLQSLVHLLQSESVEQLGVEAQEYTQRIQNVARKASGLVRFLKEVGRLAEHAPNVECVSLPVLARELRAELVQNFPRRKLHFAWSWEVETVRTDGRLLHQAALEMLQARLEQGPARLERIRAGSRRTDRGTEIYFALDALNTAEGGHDGAAQSTRRRTETPHETLLARECLAHCGAHLLTGSAHDDRFAILLPESPPHG